jgi:hypothetical protein
MLFLSILKKPHFDGNDLGKLGNIEALPTQKKLIFVKQNFSVVF